MPPILEQVNGAPQGTGSFLRRAAEAIIQEHWPEAQGLIFDSGPPLQQAQQNAETEASVDFEARLQEAYETGAISRDTPIEDILKAQEIFEGRNDYLEEPDPGAGDQFQPGGVANYPAWRDMVDLFKKLDSEESLTQPEATRLLQRIEEMVIPPDPSRLRYLEPAPSHDTWDPMPTKPLGNTYKAG